MRFTALLILLTASTISAQDRVPWTSSRLTGSPEPAPPYLTERAYPDLKFNQPVTIARVPGSNRILVMELRGQVVTFPDRPDVSKADPFIDLAPIPNHWRSYGLAFHPNFTKNREVYVCYVLKAPNPKGSRVSRFLLKDTDPPTLDPKSETVLLEWPSGGHNGGCLQFGPDGYLYISTGDGSDPNPPDRLSTGQDIGDLLASILRIDVDAKDPGLEYRIPKDNPFATLAGARPEVWAYGMRNPWKMCFEPKTGALWVGDVGWEMWELIFRVEKGGNYGWSVFEGRQSVRSEMKRGPTPILPPTLDHDHTEARSITGGRFYVGSKLNDLRGAYIYGDYVTGKLWGLRHDGAKITWKQHLADSPLEIIDFGEDTNNEMLILEYGGTIHRLVPNPRPEANLNFPKKLSETGLFASLKEQKPAPGVLPYKIHAEPWADHATAERFFAAPGIFSMGQYEKANLQAGIVKGAWIYPNDAVFAKTMSLELERGKPESRRRIETQVLHRDRGTWRAYNYIWNDEQTDAVLAGAEGSDRAFNIREGDRKLQQTWHFSSRTECLICHTTRAGSILGFNVQQLDHPEKFAKLGLFENPLPEKIPAIPNPWDAKQSLHDRARAYLHANCAHCHRRGGGGTAPFELLYEIELKKMPFYDVRPTQGTFEIASPAIVACGDPYRSTLYYRMAKLGPGHMPYAGANVIDPKGLDLIHDWIEQLPTILNKSPEKGTITADAFVKRIGDWKHLPNFFSTTSDALRTQRAIDKHQVPASAQTALVDAGAKHPDANIRDLFEKYLPEDQRVKRLGSSVKAETLLALKGEASRGRHLFFKSTATQCRNCHRIEKEGQELGPDLTQIGKKYNRGQLLESILEPSKFIDPKFVTYSVETSAGVVYTGLLLKKTDAEIVIRDNQGKVVTLKAQDVDAFTPLAKSMMPELLLKDMTASDVADLLAFLETLK